MKKTLTALALGASLFAGAASAQDSAMTMDVALSMLELSASNQLHRLGFNDQDVMDLTLSQIALIKNVAQSNDYNQGEKKAQIQKILTN